ncbi:NADP-dependent oxidoreductase [Mycolicibacterium sp.]|uniref:NADP-dependent oxidoreductase n=1 Tax=Mycolicibacterium sp. TaxID=2320850 RepID=UPI0037C8CAF7
MKALVATEYGPPDRMSVAELPVPDPGPGQIQMRIAACTINPTDIRAIGGGFGQWVDLEFPYVPGNDFAGTVTAVGAGVTRFQVGDEVFGQGLPRQMAFGADPDRPSVGTGAVAEYAVYEADTPLIALRPDSVTPEQAAALAIGGWTAIGIMKKARIADGERALVIGGLGGVGTALIPLLEKAGAHVTATARTSEDEKKLRELGAAETIGFDPAGYPGNVDAVINLVLDSHGLPAAASALRSGGRLVSIVFPPPELEDLGRGDVELDFLFDTAGALVSMQEVADAAAAGDLVATIRQVYPMDDAVTAAVVYSKGGVRGNIVVTP